MLRSGGEGDRSQSAPRHRAPFMPISRRSTAFGREKSANAKYPDAGENERGGGYATTTPVAGQWRGAGGAASAGPARGRRRVRGGGYEGEGEGGGERLLALRREMHQRHMTTGQLFAEMDSARTDSVPFRQFCRGLNMAGVAQTATETELRCLFDSFDDNQDNRVSYQEVLAALEGDLDLRMGGGGGGAEEGDTEESWYNEASSRAAQSGVAGGGAARRARSAPRQRRKGGSRRPPWLGPVGRQSGAGDRPRDFHAYAHPTGESGEGGVAVDGEGNPTGGISRVQGGWVAPLVNERMSTSSNLLIKRTLSPRGASSPTGSGGSGGSGGSRGSRGAGRGQRRSRLNMSARSDGAASARSASAGIRRAVDVPGMGGIGGVGSGGVRSTSRPRKGPGGARGPGGYPVAAGGDSFRDDGGGVGVGSHTEGRLQEYVATSLERRDSEHGIPYLRLDKV